MTPGPVQTSLFLLCAAVATAAGAGLFKRPSLRYIRWYVAGGAGACLVQDLIGTWILMRPGGENWVGPYMVAELSGALSWMLFSRRYARPNSENARAPHWYWVIAFSILSGVVAAGSGYLSLPPAGTAVAFPLTTPGFILQTLTLAILIMTLTNLETTLVNSVHGQRWRIKFTILGVFSILAAQVFTISLGLLYRSLDLSLIPARQTGFVLGMGFMLYSTLFRGGETPVTVSKRLARSSVVLLGAGAYLLFLGTLGLVLGLTGYSGNKALFLALGLILGVAVLAIMLSEGFRRRINRILQNYFYREKYDYRVQWLSFTKRLSKADSREKLYEAVLLGFCETFGMSGAVLYLRDSESKRMLAAQTWETESPPFMDNWEAVSRPVRSGLPAIDIRGASSGFDNESLAFLARAEAAFAVPLMRDDVLDGFIMLAKPIDASEQYTQEDIDLMEALATQAYSAMLNHRLTAELAKARDMEVMGKVSAFIVHDLKNLVYTLSLILDNAKRYIQNPEFQSDMLKGLENTVSKMHFLISQLRQLPSRENLNLESLDLMRLARDTFKHSPELGIDFRGAPATAMADKSQMQKVVLNLALNAIEAGNNGSPVVIETGTDTSPYLRVIDAGCGMSRQFIRESLFQPFKTTKTKGMGIGLYQCKQIVEAHGGAIEVESAVGTGSTFTVRFPSAQASGSPEDA